MPSNASSPLLKLTLPKGRIQAKVEALLEASGLTFSTSQRSYRPVCNDPAIETKLLKPQNLPALVALGRHDCGFTGADWVYEQQADVEELLDLGFDPVRIVAAMPEALAQSADNPLKNPGKRIVLASEYKRLSQDFIAQHQLNAVYVQTYGATEALPPEDADIIVDNTATGSTLRLNRLSIVAELMRSTTRFIANKEALKHPEKRKRLEELVMLMEARLRAKSRVMLEMNVPEAVFETVVNQLPAMRAPTVAQLHGGQGFVIKAAVESSQVNLLIPKLVAAGAVDIVEYKLEKLI